MHLLEFLCPRGHLLKERLSVTSYLLLPAVDSKKLVTPTAKSPNDTLELEACMTRRFAAACRARLAQVTPMLDPSVVLRLNVFRQ
jgi:hypothetical protein